MIPSIAEVRLRNTCRLVPSRFPTVGIFDTIADAADLEAIFELESWTNDRISSELGLLYHLPRSEWVTGVPMASVVMAPFCHPRPGGGRFNGPERGAWYAGLSLETAQAEVVYHRTLELREVGIRDARVQMRLYQADFSGQFHDVRSPEKKYERLHHPRTYEFSQAFARALLDDGSNGVLYRSVRFPAGECLACFRPKLVLNVRAGAHFEYRWSGGNSPVVRRLRNSN